MDSHRTHRGAIVVTACGRTHRGRVRNENQDLLLVADLADGSGPHTPTPEERHRDIAVGPLRFEPRERGAILLVADGMGGRAGGGLASALAVAAVGRALTNAAPDHDAETEASSPDAFVLRLRGALEEANREIFDEAARDPRYAGMGTTATLAGVLGDVVYVAQVGDSRAYLVRGDAAVRLTRDQSLLQDLVDSGVLSDQEAQRAPSNKILQALGVKKTVEPVVTYQELRRGDLLLLCSDGLSKVVRDEEILEAARETADCLALCDRLIGLANDRGGPDNITVVVARVEGDGLQSPDGGPPPERRPWIRAEG